MKKLDQRTAVEVVKVAFEITNPIKPHEAKIIANVLGGEVRHEWRFKNHVFCRGCRRELSALDMFLSSLEHHPPSMLREHVYGDRAPRLGAVVYESDDGPKIRVMDHSISVTCVNCGVVNESSDDNRCNIYIYSHPVIPPTLTEISMSTEIYNQVLATAKQRLKARRTKA
ncbi:hypothetical protein [Pandoraea apista]|uniref:hypothetical protein n=1 Tax=Pandoraea apista TaxID=93218 RepID=UPI0012E1B0E5|nr:hypothetical protein [Pandoraea apista]